MEQKQNTIRESFPFTNNERNMEFLRQEPNGCGEANGYVAIPPEHPLHGKSYWGLPIYGEFHELTFSGKFPIEGWKWRPCSEMEVPEDIKDWWVFGFDTMHIFDNPDTAHTYAVIKETINLKQRLDDARYEEFSEEQFDDGWGDGDYSYEDE